MKKDHRENIVGPWARQKLNCLEAYLEYYGTAIKNTKFKRVYIDAFSGSAFSEIRKKEVLDDDGLLPYEDDDILAQEEFIRGSPIRALNLRNPFHEYYFFDMDKTRASELSKNCSDRVDVKISVGDCNPSIRSLADKLHDRRYRGVAFLDPYGAHLEWDTVVSLANTGTMEVIINFPLSMAINRLITRSGGIPDGWRYQLSRCFGTEEWLNLAYSKTADLFGDLRIQKDPSTSSRLLNLYICNLKKIFPYVAAPSLIKNTRGAPLYYLIWAGPNKLGLTGAKYILEHGERIARSRLYS